MVGRVCPALKFLSTPSARRATRLPCSFPFTFHISIHALREEGDGSSASRMRRLSGRFLSTPSARRATAKTEKNISVFVSL